jgi:hypothetical protein
VEGGGCGFEGAYFHAVEPVVRLGFGAH